MKKVNTHEVKGNFSRYLEQVERGETIIVCRRNVPVAKLGPVASRPLQARPVGRARGRFQVPESFFEPLPEELVDDFAGSED